MKFKVIEERKSRKKDNNLKIDDGNSNQDPPRGQDWNHSPLLLMERALFQSAASGISTNIISTDLIASLDRNSLLNKDKSKRQQGQCGILGSYSDFTPSSVMTMLLSMSSDLIVAMRICPVPK